ncbi:MAG: DNA-directed RNA polymerase specialized sigma24 family protein, partial [Saprospiraceae bacterium]
MVAEDVVQEVLIKVWKKKSELSAIENIEAWCM